MSILRPALSMLLFFSVLTGLVYPLLVTGVAQALMPDQASGSLVELEGRVVGSELLGQPFTSEGYLWCRPSATGAHPYDAAASSGSNLGPTNPALTERIAASVAALSDGREVPVDLVTTSGSGLDPHISPEGALFQAARIARARGVDEARVRGLLEAQIEPPTLGLLGAARVNVLRANLALDAELGASPSPAAAP